jgi:hypothetical protein
MYLVNKIFENKQNTLTQKNEVDSVRDLVNTLPFDKYDKYITHHMFSGSGLAKRISPVCYFEQIIHPSKVDENIYTYEITYDKLNKNGSKLLSIKDVFVLHQSIISNLIYNNISIHPILHDVHAKGLQSISKIPIHGFSYCYRENTDGVLNVVVEFASKQNTPPALLIEYVQSAFNDEKILKTYDTAYFADCFIAHEMEQCHNSTTVYTYKLKTDTLKGNMFLYSCVVCLPENDQATCRYVKSTLRNKDKDEEAGEILHNVPGIHASYKYNNNPIKVLQKKDMKGYLLSFSVECEKAFNEHYILPGAINLTRVNMAEKNIIITVEFDHPPSTTPLIVLSVGAHILPYIRLSNTLQHTK